MTRWETLHTPAPLGLDPTAHGAVVSLVTGQHALAAGTLVATAEQ